MLRREVDLLVAASVSSHTKTIKPSADIDESISDLHAHAPAVPERRRCVHISCGAPIDRNKLRNSNEL
jgi:hypothetical protein